ncbi:hypothetical protein PIB30_012116 [Stylosanthes scabra]|uniref:Cystatin domain-containing protein n=1 Tax=Stylosanthes scabra TaxID=79078 RepID=A0ABU6R5Y4_9FABA|nr:hypothetical protein [Stylosanthes scabra]
MANVGDKRERDVDDKDSDSDSDEEIDYDTIVYTSYSRKPTDEELNEYYRLAYSSKGFLVPVIGGTIHGGIEPYDFTDESDKQCVTDLAKQAMQFYNEKNNASFEFDHIVRVNSQVVAGYVFYITFIGCSAGNNATQTFYGKVWKKFYDLGTIVKFCETDLECIS